MFLICSKKYSPYFAAACPNITFLSLKQHYSSSILHTREFVTQCSKLEHVTVDIAEGRQKVLEVFFTGLDQFWPNLKTLRCQPGEVSKKYCEQLLYTCQNLAGIKSGRTLYIKSTIASKEIVQLFQEDFRRGRFDRIESHPKKIFIQRM